MPTTFVIGGGKGGVGKSTISINLAVYLSKLGKAVALIDCDPKQRSSAKFFERTSRYSVPCETIAKDLLRSLRGEDKSVAEQAYKDFEAVVFDAPGDIEISIPLFRIADVVVLPTRPQFPDVEELSDAATVVAAIRDMRRVDSLDALVVLTQGDPRTNVAREAIRELEAVQRDLRIPVSLNHLHYSVKFAEAYAAYVAVGDLKRVPSKPKQQMEALVKEIHRYGERAERRKHKAPTAGQSGRETGSQGSGGGEEHTAAAFAAAGNE